MGNDNDEDTIPKPYGLLFHPYLNWKEKTLSPLLDYMIGAKRLESSQCGTQEATDALEATRMAVAQSSSPALLKYSLQRWETLAECPVAETKGSIPFLPNILKDWGIVKEGDLLPEAASTDRTDVGVVVRFPSSLLGDCPSTTTDSGCVLVEFETIDWKTFAPDVPLILQFHGGAFVMGIGDDVLLTEEIARLAETTLASSKDVINVCVDYALAPEHAFPVGIMDALSVVDFFLNGRKSIHVSGVSAGATIALVAGMEGMRRFPGKIASIQAQSPYCNPGADGLSYWMNQSVSPGFLRWPWRAYLGLEERDDDEDDDDDPETTNLEKVLRKGSNHTSWKKWRQKYPKGLHRLANPALDVPGNLNGDKTPKAPALILRYNRGDPVHSDAVMVIDALKPNTGGNASFYELDGLHCSLFAPYDATNPQECYQVWAEALFGST